MNNDWANYSFGKYKKAKYKLYVNNQVAYSFVTTLRSEEECVDLLKKMAINAVSKYTKSFSITKTIEGDTTTLYIGSVKGM